MNVERKPVLFLLFLSRIETVVKVWRTEHIGMDLHVLYTSITSIICSNSVYKKENSVSDIEKKRQQKNKLCVRDREWAKM